jgi:hypothetical protein
MYIQTNLGRGWPFGAAESSGGKTSILTEKYVYFNSFYNDKEEGNLKNNCDYLNYTIIVQ